VSRPRVSCICPTYGRPPDYQHLLEEAIAAFLRQTYPNKELIVVNDCSAQELICDAPGVRVVNMPERFPSLGDKYNAAIALSTGELLAPWEDDDISLPWRLSLSVERLGEADYFNPRRYWFLDGDGLHADRSLGVGHNQSLFRRAAFDTVGGYLAISGPQDYELDRAFRCRVRCVGEPSTGQDELLTSEWYYVYRWGVQPWHLSSSTSPEAFYRDIGSLRVRRGRFRLYPHWRRDYEAETRAMLG
jgi:glycosyltransferase involved in cell wall biosynthesis